MKVSYEWDVETIDLYGDIEDHWFAESAEEALSFLKKDIDKKPIIGFKGQRLVIVRDEGDGIHGVTDRLWAYVKKDGNLPEFFENAAGEETRIRVPKKYHAELKAAKNAAGI